jgi:hypothetical protein
MEDRQGKPAGWERAGVIIGLVVALAIMWGVLGFALIAGEGSGSSSSQVIYDQSDTKKQLDEDE